MKFIGNDSSLWLVDFGGSEEILVRGECLVRRVAEERVDVQRFVFLGLNRKGSRAVATTKDLGLTWTEHVSSRSALQEPVCMASLISVKAKDNILDKDILTLMVVL